MTQFYDEMAQLVKDLLAEFGTDITLNRTDLKTGNVTTSTLRGVFTDPNSYRIRPIELTGREVRIVVDSQIQVLVTDRLTHARGTFIINRIDPIQPADTVLGYRIEAKAG